MKAEANISLLSLDSPQIENDLHKITQIINEAYDLTEGVMFKENYVRTHVGEIEKKVKKNTMLVARIGEEIVGGIYTEQLDKEKSTFGMLAVDPNYMGMGIGNKLITAAEERALQLGSRFMNIEIVRSHKIPMPHKDVLFTWYQRLGYEYLGERLVESMYPQIISEIIYEGVIQVFQKSLKVPKTP